MSFLGGLLIGMLVGFVLAKLPELWDAWRHRDGAPHRTSLLRDMRSLLGIEDPEE